VNSHHVDASLGGSLIVADVGPKGTESGLPARPTMNLPNSLTVLRIFFVPVLIVVLLTRSPPTSCCGGFPMHFEVWGVLIPAGRGGHRLGRRIFCEAKPASNDPGNSAGSDCGQVADFGGLHFAGGNARFERTFPCSAMDGGDHYRAGVHDFGFAEHCVGGGLHHRRVRPWKTKMVLQVCAVAVLIVGARHPSIRPVSTVLLWLVVISALVSAAHISTASGTSWTTASSSAAS